MNLQSNKTARSIRSLEDDGLIAEAASLAGFSAWRCDLATEALEWTDGVFALFGLPQDTRFDRRDTLALYTEESRETMERLRHRAITERSGFSMEAQIQRPDGTLRWMRLTAGTRVENGRAVHIFGMKQDITEERRRWDELRNLAESDPLTGLANRARFQSGFLDLAAGSDALERLGALVLFDLDNFKAINDRWGHAAGDACIMQFGRRLTAAFPQAHMIARIGGDEFAMLMPSALPHLAVERVVRRRLNALASPVEWRDSTVPLGVSVGLSFTDAARSPESVFHAADLALYAAKRSGRNAMRIAA